MTCSPAGVRDHPRGLVRPDAHVTFEPRAPFSGGSISAILRRQSASDSCGPETNVPLTFVLYQPDTTPSRSDSSILTWRGERFCMCLLSNERPKDSEREKIRLINERRSAQPSPES